MTDTIDLDDISYQAGTIYLVTRLLRDTASICFEGALNSKEERKTINGLIALMDMLVYYVDTHVSDINERANTLHEKERRQHASQNMETGATPQY
jgi:hypothetical protein